MKKGFIFDVDGVIVNSEIYWEKFEKKFFSQILSKKNAKKLDSIAGVDLKDLYKIVDSLGAQISWQEFKQAFFKQAEIIYKKAKLTKGINQLGKKLLDLQFSIAIVSASPQNWFESTIEKLSFKDEIKAIISLFNHKKLRPKPHPDGYLEAIERLRTIPENTIILEDSNSGIAAAKASGAFTIALQENLLPGYQQKGADKYAKDIQEVSEFVENFV